MDSFPPRPRPARLIVVSATLLALSACARSTAARLEPAAAPTRASAQIDPPPAPAPVSEEDPSVSPESASAPSGNASAPSGNASALSGSAGALSGSAGVPPAPGSAAVPAASPRATPPPSSTPPTTLTLADCQHLALTRNLQLARARRGVALARADQHEAAAGLWPRLGAAAQFSDRSNDNAIVFGPTALSFTDRAVTTGEVRLDVPLFNAGDPPGRRAAAARGVDAAASDRARAGQDVALAIEAVFWEALADEAGARSAEQALSAAQAQRDAAKDRAAGGLGLESDALAAEVRVAQREQERAHARNAVEDARARLAWTIGLPPEQPIVPADDGAAPPATVAPELLLGQARAQRPDLRAARARVDQAAEGLRALRFGHAPSVSAFGGYAFDDDSHLVNNGWFEGGVAVQVPILDRTVDARVERAQEILGARRDELAQLEQDVALALTRARLALADAADVAPVAAHAAEVAERRLGEVRDQYRHGLADVASALAAEAEAADAAARRDQAIFAWRIAAARLRNALGGGAIPTATTPSTGTP